MDHIRERHHMGVTIKAANLGEWFPPWTVTRAAWNMAVKSNIYGISTDVLLFSEHGAQFVHHYRVFGDCVAHASLREPFMIDLLYFTNLACAEARWAAKRSLIRVLGRVHHRIDWVDRTVVLHATCRTMILRLGKLLGL